MVILGKLLDYSQARPNLAAVKKAGYSAVYRYVCSNAAEAGLPGKRLTPSERDAILHAGLDIGLHGEDNNGAAQAGYSRGLEQGKQWAGYAHDVLGAPQGMTIVAAIDYDTVQSYPPIITDYLRGIKDGFAGQYTVGVYGSLYVVDAALAEHSAVHGVQTNAWSNGKISNFAHVYQHGGDPQFPGTDYNDILRVPHGTWLQTKGGFLMALTDAQQLDMYNDIQTINAAVAGHLPPIETHAIAADSQTQGLGGAVKNVSSQVTAVSKQCDSLAAQCTSLATQLTDLQAAVDALAAGGTPGVPGVAPDYEGVVTLTPKVPVPPV
jgi:hypothetical protein